MSAGSLPDGGEQGPAERLQDLSREDSDVAVEASASLAVPNGQASEYVSSGRQANTRNYNRASWPPEDTDDPWIRKNLLAFDGGGIRGYSSLLILQALMKQIVQYEQETPQAWSSVHPLQHRTRKICTKPKGHDGACQESENDSLPIFGPETFASHVSHYLPCHYFDYIAGTSTGGLIAIMLGRLGMSVGECIEAYQDLADRVFGHPRILHVRRPPFIPRHKYDPKHLKEVIEEVAHRNDPNPEGNRREMFPQLNPDMCRTIVISRRVFLGRHHEPYLFRSYYHPSARGNDGLVRNPNNDDNYAIWEVGRATSAAPPYFRPMRLARDHQSKYIDGGFGSNNPSEEAYWSVRQYHGDHPRALKVLVSIGTGKSKEFKSSRVPFFGRFIEAFNMATAWAVQSERTHEMLARNLRGNAEYYRLNVDDIEGLGRMKLDNWKGKKGSQTLRRITDATDAYLATAEAQSHISESARHLVQVRRARVEPRHGDRWDRFCHGVVYMCPIRRCREASTQYGSEDQLRNHLQHHESITTASELDNWIQNAKQYPLHGEGGRSLP